MTAAPPLQLIVGPAGHGVVEYAADVGAAMRTIDPRADTVHVDSVAAAVDLARQGPRAHLHVTDRLLGRSPEEAVRSLELIAGQTRLTITLHDVPQTSDGTGLSRRVAAYSGILAAARAAAVNSRHEQQLVAEFLPGAPATHVIPLGARHGVPPSDAGQQGSPADGGFRPLVALVAGYIYPGKGHAPAIQAAAEAARILRQAHERVGAVVVRAIGRPSAGHERDVTLLQADAERRGVDFQVTGFLDDATFTQQLVEDGIPIAAHEHVSASRSMLDWVEVGRRPLVISSRYSQEMAALRPDTLVLYEPDDLPRQLVAAWREPARTWLKPGSRLTPTLADVAADYLAWWHGMDPA